MRAAEAGVKPVRRRALWLAAAVVGYILSPLSAWNDAFVNVPIALLFSRLFERLGLSPWLGFQAGYTLSNVAGLALLYAGARGVRGGGLTRREAAKALLLGFLYSLAASIILSFLGLL